MGFSSAEAGRKVGEQFGYPFMLKSRLGGYDGKGNAVIKKAEEPQRCLATRSRGQKESLSRTRAKGGKP